MRKPRGVRAFQATNVVAHALKPEHVVRRAGEKEKGYQGPDPKEGDVAGHVLFGSQKEGLYQNLRKGGRGPNAAREEQPLRLA